MPCARIIYAKDMIEAAKRGEVAINTGESPNVVYQGTGEVILRMIFQMRKAAG